MSGGRDHTHSILSHSCNSLRRFLRQHEEGKFGDFWGSDHVQAATGKSPYAYPSQRRREVCHEECQWPLRQPVGIPSAKANVMICHGQLWICDQEFPSIDLHSLGLPFAHQPKYAIGQVAKNLQAETCPRRAASIKAVSPAELQYGEVTSI